MRKVLMTPNGKKVVIDRKTDPCLYSAPVNPPNTGTRYTTGTDLFAHKARSGKMYYYFYEWSMWQGEESSYELCSKSEAEEFLISKLSNDGWDSISEEKAVEIEKDFGFNLLNETA